MTHTYIHTYIHTYMITSIGDGGSGQDPLYVDGKQVTLGIPGGPGGNGGRGGKVGEHVCVCVCMYVCVYIHAYLGVQEATEGGVER
jgi:hypothetical protein